MSLGDTHTHLKLVNKMAQVQGFDLTQERARGAVSDADFADILTRCRGCSDASGCAHALDQGEAPRSCANNSRWDALRVLTGM